MDWNIWATTPKIQISGDDVDSFKQSFQQIQSNFDTKHIQTCANTGEIWMPQLWLHLQNTQFKISIVKSIVFATSMRVVCMRCSLYLSVRESVWLHRHTCIMLLLLWWWWCYLLETEMEFNYIYKCKSVSLAHTMLVGLVDRHTNGFIVSFKLFKLTSPSSFGIVAYRYGFWLCQLLYEFI